MKNEKEKSIRSGSWVANDDLCRSPFRSRESNKYWENYIGFRILIKKKP
jgi:formylglycine-generating enzyme required for sulfatase activity